MKKLLKLILSLGLVASMAACSSNKPAEGTTTEGGDVSTEGVEIVIWHTFTEAQEAELQRLAAAYGEATGVTVTCQSQPYNGFESTVYEAVTNGVGPDFLFNYASYALDYDAYGKSLNFSKYWDADFDYASLVSAGVYEECTQGFADGGVHAVAVQTTGPVFFYNADWAEELGLEAPVTWDDVKANAQAIYAAKGVPGFAIDSMSDFLQILILQENNGKYIDLDTNTLLFDTPEVKAWVEWFKEGCIEGYFQVAPTTGDYNSNDMNGGVLGAYIGSSAGIPYLSGFTVGCCPVPQIDPSNPYVVGWNRSVVGFTSDDEAKNAAIAGFAKFMTEAENDKGWVMTLNAYSPYYATQELEDYKDYVAQDVALIALGQQMDYAVVIPSFTNATTVRDLLKELMTSAASDSNSDVDALFESCVAKSNAAINE